MFGREARMPVDLGFGTSGDGTQQRTYLKYVTELRKELKTAYELAESIAAKQNDGNKRRYDKKIRFSQLLPGDRVLIRNLGLQGKHKLADRWASNIYVVESQLPNLPVFKLKPENGSGPVKILHRNHILPVGQNVNPEPVLDSDAKRVLRRRRRRQNKDRKEKERSSQRTQECVNGETKPDQFAEDDHTDSENEEYYNLWTDLSVDFTRDAVYDAMPEPFSLDLDVANEPSGQSETVELEVMEPAGKEPEQEPATEGDGSESIEESRGHEFPETCQPPDLTIDGTLDVQSPLQPSQPETDTDDVTVTEGVPRVRRAPLRLTYDSPGQPSVTAIPTIRYVSCLFMWMGSPLVA